MDDENKKNNDDMDALSTEYNLALEEHKIVNAQMILFQESNTRLYEFGLVALGAIVVAATFVIEQEAYNLLLVLSIPFHVLMWLQTRRGIISNHLANYVIFEIAPRMRNTINLRYEGRETSTFVFWEEYIARIWRKRRVFAFVAGLSEAGRIAYQMSVAATLVVAYFFYKSSNPHYVSTWLDTGLLILNGIAFFLSIFGLIVETAFYGDPKESA